MDELKSPGKPFDISKRAVWEAYQKVKANKGAPGVDGVSIEEFEKDLKDNLYKIWNRMSSGSYFPPPVRAVEIAKSHGGGTRTLGVPTVADRVAQTVVAAELEAKVEPIFHPDSYGYRPRRSALDAVAACRRRCWKTDWVIDLDIRKFFDSVPWELMVKAVEANTDLPWVVLYVRRWLHAPLPLPEGPCSSGTGEPHRVRRSRPSWRICSCTTRSNAGWPGSFPGSGSNATSMTRSCTASARPRPVGARGDRGSGWAGRAGAASGQDQDRVLPGRQAARLATSTPRSRSWGTRSGPRGARTRTGKCSRLPTRRSARTP